MRVIPPADGKEPRYDGVWWNGRPGRQSRECHGLPPAEHKESADYYPPVPERSDDHYFFEGKHCHREKCCHRICHYEKLRETPGTCHHTARP